MGVDLSTAQAKADALQAEIANAPASTQQAWAQATSPAANEARIAAGAAAAPGLLAHGVDFSNPADTQAVISLVAGAVSLIPIVGTMLGGALEVIDLIGEAAAGALVALGLQQPPGCKSSGTWTAQQILDGYITNGGADVTPGTFGAMLWPALAYDEYLYLTCQPNYGPAAVIAGMVALWNANALGVALPVWAPPPESIVWTGYGTTTIKTPNPAWPGTETTTTEPEKPLAGNFKLVAITPRPSNIPNPNSVTLLKTGPYQQPIPAGLMHLRPPPPTPWWATLAWIAGGLAVAAGGWAAWKHWPWRLPTAPTK